MAEATRKSRPGRRLSILAMIGLLGVVLLAWGPCCSNFDQSWRAAGSKARPRVERLAGRWEGAWVSKARDMSGTLRCAITKLEDGRYEARFRSTYAGFMKHNSTVVLTAEDAGDRWTFKGQSDLGWLYGGVYTYEGHSDGTEYFCTYKATGGDHGEFRMTRKAEQPAPRPTDGPAGASASPVGQHGDQEHVQQ